MGRESRLEEALGDRMTLGLATGRGVRLGNSGPGTSPGAQRSSRGGGRQQGRGGGQFKRARGCDRAL